MKSPLPAKPAAFEGAWCGRGGAHRHPTRVWVGERLDVLESGLLYDRALEHHRAKAWDFAGDVVVAVDEADVGYLGADLQRALRAFYFEALRNDDVVPVVQNV